MDKVALGPAHAQAQPSSLGSFPVVSSSSRSLFDLPTLKTGNRSGMYLPNPPAHGHPDDGEERPPFVLIEPYAYFAAADRDNATTATCSMTGFHGTFKVTFCAARPPLVSYMCFQATDHHDTVFGGVEPEILAAETDGPLVLLRLVFGKHPSAIMFPRNREYLVYDASGPSLVHLPHPGTSFRFSDDSIAFVRRPHGGSSSRSYVLAAHSGIFVHPQPSKLYLYHSDTETWEETRLALKPNPSSSSSYPAAAAAYHSTCKAVTVGGDRGTVAWVDLWRNIVLCDNLLAKRPKLRYLPLPPPIVLYSQPRSSSDPRSLRDIALVDDGSLFRYVQIQPGSHDPLLGHWEWEVTVWSAKTSSSSAQDWHMDYRLSSSELSLPELLRVDPGRAQPTLSALQIGLPNLSLQDDGIVYLLSKFNHWDNDHVAWVLVVDMRNKTIQKVGEFNPARTLGLSKGYNATRISKFLKGTKKKPEKTRDAVAEIL